MRPALPLAALLIAGTAGCGGSTSTLDSDLGALRAGDARPAYYLGESFEDLPLTHVEHGPRGSLFVYGSCEPNARPFTASALGTPLAGDDGRCGPPFQLQIILCPHDLPGIAIFGNDQHQLEQARYSLEPLNAQARKIRFPRAAIGENPFGICFASPGTRHGLPAER